MGAFQKAERRAAKARVLLAGPSGSGKSYSALILARGLVGEGGKIAAVDTEHGSLSLYSDLTDFDVCAMAAPFSPQAYIRLIGEAAAAGYDALVIDSITHEWAGPGGILDIKDKMEGGNDYTKWGKLTPLHDSFIQAMLTSPMHIIATVRSRQDYALEENDKGKQEPKKLGMAPQQRDGMDYEFTICFDIDITHNARASKDRTSLFGEDYGPIKPEYGERLARWLDSGSDTPAPEPVSIRQGPNPDGPTKRMVEVARDINSLRKGTPFEDGAAFRDWLGKLFPDVKERDGEVRMAKLTAAQLDLTLTSLVMALKAAAEETEAPAEASEEQEEPE